METIDKLELLPEKRPDKGKSHMEDLPNMMLPSPDLLKDLSPSEKGWRQAFSTDEDEADTYYYFFQSLVERQNTEYYMRAAANKQKSQGSSVEKFEFIARTYFDRLEVKGIDNAIKSLIKLIKAHKRHKELKATLYLTLM